MRRADRLFQIVQHMRARRLTTAAQLADFLAISERTIYRDIRDLSLAGMPIQGEAGVGYCLDRSFELTALMFTPDEVEALVVGLRMAQAFGGPKLRVAAIPALDKVILALPKARRAEVERPRIYAPPFNEQRADDALMELLGNAITERTVLQLTYSDDHGRQTEREIRPLALHFWGSVWTLAGWCQFRQDFRSFRLDRIRVCLQTGETFPEEQGKTLADFLRQAGVR